MPGMEAQLAAVLHDQDGAARHFAAGAAGGRDGNQRQHGIGDAGRAAFDGGVLRQRSGVRGRDGNALGAVDGGAAADGNETVTALAARHFHAGQHRGLGGVGADLIEDGEGLPCEHRFDLVQQPCGAHTRIGHDQRLAHADAGDFGGQLGQGTVCQVDVGDVLDQGHAGNKVEVVRRPLYDGPAALALGNFPSVGCGPKSFRAQRYIGIFSDTAHHPRNLHCVATPFIRHQPCGKNAKCSGSFSSPSL